MEIKDILPETEILAQLAEEAAELAQAALKLRRVLDGTNPTPVTEGAARNDLVEEYGDVLNCADQLFSALDLALCADMRDRADQLLPFERRYPELKTPTYGERRR